MFTTSFIPVATAWVGRGLNSQGPELFYFVVYTFWTAAYIWLTRVMIRQNQLDGHDQAAQDISYMKIYKAMTNWKIVVGQLVVLILILIYMPALQMVVVFLQIMLLGMRFNDDSDDIERR